jgi:two-component system osmolarity sensor histidine kinase EnvZ
MLRRLGFTGRLMAIVMLALVALWAIGVGWIFVSETREQIASRLYPLPEQAAAIVDLIDATEPARRPAVLKAVSSETLRVTIEREPPTMDVGSERLPVVEQFLSRYLRVLEPREVIATIERSGLPRWRELRFGQYWLYARQPLHLAVSLRGGDYAVFEARGQLGRRLFGLPPGFGVGALGALVGIAAILAIAREARPLRVLAARVAGFTGDALPAPVAAAGAPEIRKLIEAVNAMQERIVDLVKGRTLLLGAISHDLKTYITRLRLRVEQLPADDQRDKAVRDLDDMTALIDDALAAARGTSVSARREPVHLCELLAGLVADYPDRQVRFGSAAEADAMHIAGEPVALRRLFANLIENALRFGTCCEIALVLCGAHLRVTVDDDGPGIPAGERRAVLEPFYRLEPSRSRATGGSGLGLAIVKQIAEAHGGTVFIAASPPGGTRVAIMLPADSTMGPDC